MSVVQAELSLTMWNGLRSLALKKIDGDTWMFVLSEKRSDGVELPRKTLVVNAAELREVCNNRNLFREGER